MTAFLLSAYFVSSVETGSSHSDKLSRSGDCACELVPPGAKETEVGSIWPRSRSGRKLSDVDPQADVVASPLHRMGKQ
eukprot:SAG31_NODE_2370_length_5852_cov_2.750391_5_plen_78_part_00